MWLIIRMLVTHTRTLSGNGIAIVYVVFLPCNDIRLHCPTLECLGNWTEASAFNDFAWMPNSQLTKRFMIVLRKLNGNSIYRKGMNFCGVKFLRFGGETASMLNFRRYKFLWVLKRMPVFSTWLIMHQREIAKAPGKHLLSTVPLSCFHGVGGPLCFQHCMW